jgi:hypothetical protein
MPTWLLHFLGLDSASGTAYLALAKQVSGSNPLDCSM